MKVTTNCYGFCYGPASVYRICGDEKLGVWLEVAGARECVEIRVTKGGRLRVGPVKPAKEGVIANNPVQ